MAWGSLSRGGGGGGGRESVTRQYCLQLDGERGGGFLLARFTQGRTTDLALEGGWPGGGGVILITDAPAIHPSSPIC
jgi:hypothetical protein